MILRSNRRLAIPSRALAILLAAALTVAGGSANGSDLPILKGGEKIAFLGDSITNRGATKTTGYVNLVILGLGANGITATAIPAGVEGHKSDDMLARLDRDVISKKPDWMTLSCGVNDVWQASWRPGGGVPLDQYKVNITAIVDKCQAAGIKVMILTSTMIEEDQSKPNNQKMVPYNDFLRGLAVQKNCLLADLNADMQAAVIKARADQKTSVPLLTEDGVHMNSDGDQMMALGILKAFGLSGAQLQKAQQFWLDMPDSTELGAKTKITLRQYQNLKALALQRHLTVEQLIAAEFAATLGLLTVDNHPSKPLLRN